MRNKHTTKKMKLAIVLNAMYWIESDDMAYPTRYILRHISKVLAPNGYNDNVGRLYEYYCYLEDVIMHSYDDWCVEQSYVKDYANMHNIKIYPREYFHI